MKKLLLALGLICLIAHNGYSNQPELVLKTPSDIFKTYSDIVCEIEVYLEIKGKDSFDMPQKTEETESGSCFLIKDGNGKNHIVTASHIARPEDGDLLEDINSKSITNLILGVTSTPNIPATTQNIWKEISEVKVKYARVSFKTADIDSLKNSIEDYEGGVDENNSKNDRIIFLAALEKFDHFLDLASLQLEYQPAYTVLKSGKLGNSEDLKIGSKVYAIGKPLGHSFTLLRGEVAHFHVEKSGKNRQNQIYTSEMIGFGSSGGPLFNRSGEIVGVCIRVYNDKA